MQKGAGILLLLTLLLVLFSLSGCGKYIHVPEAQQGEIELSEWNYEANGIVNLQGEWEFYWNRLYEPGQIPKSRNNFYIQVPSNWRGKSHPQGTLPMTGYGTYRLIIHHGMAGTYMGIRIPYTGTAYKMYVDEVLLSKNGTVGRSREETTPQYVNKNVYFHPRDNTSEIVMQVANFHHRRGGIWQDIQFGLKEDIETESASRMMFEILLIGSLLFMGIPLISMYIMTRFNRAPLYFGILCLLLSVRTLFIGEVIFTRIFPRVDWEAAIKSEYFFTYLTIAVTALFVHALYEKLYPKNVLIFFLTLTGLSMIFIFAAPAIIFSQVNLFFQGITLAALLFGLWVIIRAMIYRRDGVKTIFFGYIVILAIVFNNMLFFNGIIHSPTISPISFTNELAREYSLFSFWTVPMNVITFVFFLLVLNLFGIKFGVDYIKEFKKSFSVNVQVNSGCEGVEETFYRDYDISLREREIIDLITKGYSNKEIAEKISISPGTVKVHLHNIYQKTGAKNRTALTHLTVNYRNSGSADSTII